MLANKYQLSGPPQSDAMHSSKVAELSGAHTAPSLMGLTATVRVVCDGNQDWEEVSSEAAMFEKA